MTEQLTRKQKYYKENAERLREEYRNYYKENREKVLESKNKYREANKDRINEKITCEKCGSIVSRHGLAVHKKTAKCNNKNLTEKGEGGSGENL